MTPSPADLYARVKGAAQGDPALADAMVRDLPGTLAERFGLQLDRSARLERSGAGYRLTLDGRSYELADPTGAEPGELDEAELELVSGGCDPAPPPPVNIFNTPDPNKTGGGSVVPPGHWVKPMPQK